MKDRRNSKLFKAMMLSALAMLMMSAQRASAAESIIYKCINPKGTVVFQDFACADNQLMDLINVEINQSADIAPGLRPLEKVMLSRSYNRLMLDRILAAKYQPIIILKAPHN